MIFEQADDGRLLPGGEGLSAEQSAALDIERHVIVSAGAGSGKTRALTRRALRILGSFAWEASGGGDAPGPEALLVMTFTERAATEMRERIRRELGAAVRELHDRQEELAALPGVGRRVRGVAEHLARSRERFDRARIGTFHGFCAGLLRELAASAGLDPGFRILEGVEGAALRREIADLTLREAEAAPGVGERPAFVALRRRDLHRALEQRLARAPEWAAAADDLEGGTALEAVERWIARYCDADLDALENAVAPGGVVRLALQAVEGFRPGLEYGAPVPPVLDAIEDAVARFDADLDAHSPPERADRVRAFIEPFLGAGSVRKRVFRKAHHTWLGPKASWRKMHRKGLRAAWNDARETLGAHFGDRGEVLDDLPGRVDLAAVEVLRDLRALGDRAEELHRARKEAAHALDFDDLQQRLLEVLDTDDAARRRVARRFRHVLVDELQDTNETQWRLVRHLAGLDSPRPSRLFLVGDRKQAIYRFRGGDVTLFDRVVATLADARSVEFTRNYRSRAGLIQAFNALYAWLMAPAAVVRAEWEAPFAPLKAGRKLGRGGPWRGDKGRIDLLTAVDAVDPRDDRDDDDPDDGVDLVGPEREAAVVAEHIRALLPKAPVHEGLKVAVLLRRRRNMGLYSRALRRAGVPHVVAGGRGFFSRPEVLDVADVLSALLHGGDQVALVGALRGPFFALEDAWLVRLALWGRERTGGSLREGWDAAVEAVATDAAHLPEAWPEDLPDDGRRELARAATRWLRWGRLARALPLSGFLRRLLDDAAAGHLFALGDPTGQTRANVEKLVRLGGRFDARGAEGAADFARFLRRQDEADAAEGEAVVDAAAPVVLMTIHQSKGLEFPVVVLPDLNARVRPGGFGSSVTLGRVRDRTIQADRWTLGAALSMVEGRRRVRRTSLPGRRIRDRDRAEEIAEAKRLLYVAMTRARDRVVCVARPPSKAAENPRAIDDAVAWEEWLRRWRVEDPAAETRVPVVWADVLPEPPVDAGPPALPAPADLVELASVKARIAPIPAPDVRRITPHALVMEDVEPDAEVEPRGGEPEVVDTSAERVDAGHAETARLRGILVHGCLEDEITEPSPVTTRRIRRALAAEGLASEAAVARLEADLERHLAGFRAAAPTPLLEGGTVFREQPFRLALPTDGEIEGIIDVLYLDPERDCWVVLDYKSDAAAPDAIAERYAAQLLAYAWAASRILPDVRAGRRRVAAEILVTARGLRVELLPPLDVVALEARFRAGLRRVEGH